MTSSVVLNVGALDTPWPTLDPFLFCVHHADDYPQGNSQLGPAATLEHRTLGNDFELRDGWRMYHGRAVPGFPQHPHRGFETVTVVRRGLVDHSDSLGGTARYGEGDVQWLTAGRGILHCEMFPLVDPRSRNPLELFQLWLNLPRADKLGAPHFSMFWAPQVPSLRQEGLEVRVIAGSFLDLTPQAPPPQSWARRPEADVAIWTIRLWAGHAITLPPAQPASNRMLYLFRGSARVGGEPLAAPASIRVRPDAPLALQATPDAECLLLQGRPIGEPVAAWGPFVMNSADEIREAMADYRATEFGGWPWKSDEPVHPGDATRFARFPDGTEAPAPNG